MYSAYSANHQHESQGTDTLHGKNSVSVLQGDLSENMGEDDMSSSPNHEKLMPNYGYSTTGQYKMQSRHSGKESHHNDQGGGMQHHGHGHGIRPGKKRQHGTHRNDAKTIALHKYYGDKCKKRGMNEFAHGIIT